MRHRVKGRKLGRTTSHRTATLRSLATALLKHKKITTTLAKAKELRTFVEPMITRAKNDTVAARRLVARHIKDKEVVKELFSDIAEKVRERNGGYTRIVKLGQRVGDAAELAIIELVDYNEADIEKPKKSSKKKKAKKEEKVETFQEEKVEDANVVEETVEEKTTDEKAEDKEEVVSEEKAENTEEVKEEAKTEEKEENQSEEDKDKTEEKK